MAVSYSTKVLPAEVSIFCKCVSILLVVINKSLQIVKLLFVLFRLLKLMALKQRYTTMLPICTMGSRKNSKTIGLMSLRY